MNFTLIDDDCTVADLFVWISFQKLHDWFFSSSHACQFQSLLNPYSQNLEFVYERLCCGRSIFFLSWWKWKFLWWNLKNRHGFLFFFFFCYDDKHPFKYKYEWLLWANMFLCLEANQMPLSWPFLLVLSYFYVCYDPFFMVAHFSRKICCVCKKHKYEAHWKWQIYICRETNVAFGECSRWYGSAVVGTFHEETHKRALPYQYIASWMTCESCLAFHHCVCSY